MNLINFKKKVFVITLLVLNYLLVAFVVFAFSYVSLLNGKTYGWFWVKSIQKKIYFRGHRNIWQYKNNCTSFDSNLLYVPKIGSCKFINAEFETILNFDRFSRRHVSLRQKDHIENFYIVLGDSVAMGWGVNDNETFSYQLEKISKKKVYNMGVSSYGTVREIKRMKLSPYYQSSKTIIIQYHPNDLNENKLLNFNKIYSQNEYKNIFENQDMAHINTKSILKNYKTSVRLFFSDLIDFIFKEKNIEIINFNEDQKYLEKTIIENINLKEKRVIVFITEQPWQKIINFPRSKNQIEYIRIKLNKSHYFNIDDHPNSLGHLRIANILNDYLVKN